MPKKMVDNKMIKSMTGYGCHEATDNYKKITVELKSVNHKYMDLSIKMPRKFIKFEGEIRTLLKNYANRGKIDIFVLYEDMGSKSSCLKYNSSLAKEYYEYYKKIGEELGIEEEIRISTIARLPEVLVLEDEEADDETWQLLEQTAKRAFEKFEASRIREGEALKNDILLKLDEMEGCVTFIDERLPKVIEDFRIQLEEKVRTYFEEGQVDESRIASEVTMYVDKTAIDEELVRLKSHINHMRQCLKSEEAVGRNLDFIAQEMNRESNTILSKANDIEITNCGILLKTCIEKIREQSQNIE